MSGASVSKELKVISEKTQTSYLLLRYEQDHLEMYQCRETIRIVGLTEDEDENVEETFIKICVSAGVQVKPEDISVIHLTGSKRSQAARLVLLKFTSRKAKRHLMMEFKTKQELKRVYLNDDLTPLLKICKQTPGVERVSTTHDGKIACYMKPTPGSSSSNRSGSSETKYIDTPDDLFKIGISDVDYTSLGLQHFIVA
ncbi:hypothetical protein ACOMHN_059327 [Nucella lapillus]